MTQKLDSMEPAMVEPQMLVQPVNIALLESRLMPSEILAMVEPERKAQPMHGGLLGAGSSASLSTCSPSPRDDTTLGSDPNFLSQPCEITMVTCEMDDNQAIEQISDTSAVPNDSDGSMSSSSKEPIESLGTRGHPRDCGPACKYVMNKSGCLNGAKCLRCHKCDWRQAPRTKAPPLGFEEMPKKLPFEPCSPKFQLLAAANGIPSVGSIGHPYQCASACKYATKANGCKDGSACVRCHLCQWSRSLEKTYAANRATLANATAQLGASAFSAALFNQTLSGMGMGMDKAPMYIPTGDANQWTGPWAEPCGTYGKSHPDESYYYNSWSL
mmetsp:Transcript_29837/g.54656  ORF Transcript_29837/g.54656 Transcript_29837/m.54656 type:complete len:328 (+) Transcript_29837:84-1067(+)